VINEIINSTKKIKNKIFAISVAVPAMPPNPSKAAISSIIKNVIAQFNIGTPVVSDSKSGQYE